ncbi:hypothetical protein [Jeotgalibacillus campisalis]|uniref:DUF4944 domain-containing protein n=1 Tax=Jeotgalibacillus campisalis TaxID=220754 RepID=A0A0C2W515_9BACL|nr:hypothetical protein [Jeotgalibacillus campisalis]KIL51103.1 hypothetical protein KR50_09840 [Jeotgalibacillus campisalis]
MDFGLKKNRTLLAAATALFLIAWMVYSIQQAPQWTGHSDQGLWKTSYKSEYTPKDIWRGSIQWNGDSEATLKNVKLTQNGDVIHDWEASKKMKSGEETEYLSMGNGWENRSDQFLLTIQWTDAAGDRSETLRLQPRTRYFTFPSPS